MTKKQAIQTIKEHCYFANLVPVGKEALDIAIKALEQQPSEDCVNRQEVIRIADKCREYGKQKKGKWIDLSKALDNRENPCKCSICNHVLSFMNYYPKSNYCPNCGADMREE